MATLLEDLADLVGLLPDADQSAAFRTLIEKNPKFAQELKDGRLRQSDYSKSMNENKEKLKYADEMKTWADTNVPKHEKLVKDFSDLETLNKTLETQANDYRDQLAKVQAGEMNVDEATLNARVDDRIKNAGYVTQSEMQRIVKEEGTKLADERAKILVEERTNKFLSETWPAAQAINTAVIQKSFEHLQEFGKPLSDDDLKAISTIMTERSIVDPRKAYDEWVSPKRREKEVSAEVEKQVQDRISKMNFPGVSSGGLSEMGAVQLKNAGKLPAEIPAGSELGDGSAALAAAAEMRKEGNF